MTIREEERERKYQRICVEASQVCFSLSTMAPPLVRRRALSALAVAAAAALLLLHAPLIASASGSPASSSSSSPPPLLTVPLAKRKLDARSLARQAEALRARHGVASSSSSSSDSAALGSVPKGGADVDLVDFLDAQVSKSREKRRRERKEKTKIVST